MSQLNYTFSDYYQRVSEFLGLGSSPSGANLTKVKEIVYRGYKRFLFPTVTDPQTGKRKRHCWSFLTRYYTLVTEANKWQYPLPEDFGRMLTDPEFSLNAGYETLSKRNPEFILRQRNSSDLTSYPWYYAINASDYDLEIGTTWDMWLYATPDQAYTLHFFYEVYVPEPSDTTDILVGGIEAEEAILESCLAVAEQQEEDGTSAIHTQLATELIANLVAADNINSGKSLGRIVEPRSQGLDESDDNWRSTLRTIDDDNVYSD